jgi:hypothetical protein
MATTMTIAEFRQQILEMTQDRMGLEECCAYLRQATRDDKYLREEHLSLLAVIDYKTIPESEQIELGKEKKPWDARIGGRDIYEVVQALPKGEHIVRQEVAFGSQSPYTFLTHAADHLQFPAVIVDMVKKKQEKKYTDSRSLVIVFDGDYSGEDEEVIEGWVRHIRGEVTLGTFKEILLVERDRLRVFPLLPADA